MTEVPAVVELLIDGAWVDLTAADRVLTRDPITISRGAGEEASPATARPSWVSMSLRNPDSFLSPRNPMSVNYGKLGRNTPIRVREAGSTITLDTFTRTESGGWGLADDGQEYETATGTADFSTTGTRGRVSVPTTNVSRFAYVLAPADVDRTITVVGPVLATGADLKSGLCARLTDVDNFYSAQLQFNPDQTIYLELNKEVANVATVIATDTTTGLTHSAATLYRLRFQLIGPNLRCKAWLASSPEPDAWNIETTDTSLTGPGGYGVRCRSSTGNTNAHPVTFDYDDITEPDARIVAEVSKWPARRNTRGTDVWTPITASGILRRLGQGASPLRSPLTRGTLVDVDLVSYWPVEEESGAVQAAAALNGSPLKGSGFSPGGGSERGLDGSLPVATIAANAQLRAGVTTLGASGQWLIRAVVYMPSEPGVSSRVLQWHTSGSAVGWDVRFNPAGELLEIRAFDRDNVAVEADSAAFTAADLYGRWVMVEVGATNNAGNVDWHILLRGADGNEAGFTGSIPTQTCGAITAWSLVGDSEYRLGHVSVYDVNTGFFSEPLVAELMSGRAGETAIERMRRLCKEEAVPLVVYGRSAESELVGPQRAATLLELLQDAADADQGILFERRNSLAIAYRSRFTLYNQTGLALDFTDLTPPFEPTDDDKPIRNDVTVNRLNGSSARAVQETGPLNVQEPSRDRQGVGRYDDEGGAPLNLEKDERLYQIAAWLLHLGTWDEERYPSVTVKNPSAAAAAVDVGDFLSVDNVPDTFDLVELHARGYVETIQAKQREITWNCSPARPYRVAVLDSDELGKLDTDGTTRQGSVINTTQTGITFTIATGVPFWTTDVAEFPFPIVVNGEEMTVTAIAAPAGQTQLFTVVRSVNGVVREHAIGSEVHLKTPARLAL